MPLGLVLLEPVRSAEPPIIPGTAAVSASSAVSDAARVAISFGVAASFSFTERTAAASSSLGNSPRMRRSNSARRAAGTALIRSVQPWCAALPASAALRHISRISAGMAKAPSVQPRPSRAPPTSPPPTPGPPVFIGAERGAVGLLGPCLARRAEADDGAAGDQRGPVARLHLLERLRDRLGIVPVDARRHPAGGLEALDLIDGIRKRQRTVDRDGVVVEQYDQLGELEMPGERDRLLAHALHQIAVGGAHVSAMVHELGSERSGEVALGDRHADRVAQPLAERAGGRLHARREEALG